MSDSILWYYAGNPDQHCEMVSWIGEDVTLRPLDGSPEFTTNGSFAWRVLEPVGTAEDYHSNHGPQSSCIKCEEADS